MTELLAKPPPRTFTVHFHTHALAQAIGRALHLYSCNVLEEMLAPQVPRKDYPDANTSNTGVAWQASAWMQARYEQHLPHVRLSRVMPTSFVFYSEGMDVDAAMEQWMDYRRRLSDALLREPDQRVEFPCCVPWYIEPADATVPTTTNLPEEN
jgi:hypothetical protein